MHSGTMRNNASRKVNRASVSKGGFTLTELLMVILIMSMVMLLVAGGVSVARRVYLEMRYKADAQILMSTTVTAMNAELIKAKDVETGSDDTACTFYSQGRNNKVQVVNNGDKGGVCLVIEGTTYPLVTEATSSLDMYSQISDVKYITDVGTDGQKSYFVSYKMEIKESGSGKVIEEQNVMMHPVVGE